MATKFLNALIMAAAMFTQALSHSTTPSTSASSTTPVSSPPPNIFEAAIFTCANQVFNNYPIDMLFPPADASLPNIVNATLAEIVHNNNYITFCGNLSAYLYCVKEAVMKSPKDIDNKIKVYIDIGSLDSTMDTYCHNNDSIPSHFQCTKQAVESYSCPYGGIYGIMQYVAMAMQTGLSKEPFCTGIQAAIKCRIDNQLKKCGTSYAGTMEFVYHGLTDKYCL